MKPLNWFSILALTLVALCSNAPTGLCQDTKVAPSKTAPKQAIDDVDSAPEFLRVTKEGKKLQSMQTAVVTYSDPNKPNSPKVTLIGAVHIAESEYYSRLNTIFKGYDALLFEMVMNPSDGIPDPKQRGVSPVSTIQVGMKDALGLTFQLDEVDYKAKNFVHADMTPDEFFKSMKRRNEGVMQILFRSIGAGIAMQSKGKSSDVGMLMAAVGDDPQKGLRRAMAEQMVEMDGQMAGLSGDDGKSTLITERNAKAFEVLNEQIRKGKKNLGIFYGAGHLKDMHERLTEEYGMKPEKVEYLDAWSLK
ncbi:MAG: hypothetical protein U0930_18850 [Pirellulales bacterium]